MKTFSIKSITAASLLTACGLLPSASFGQTNFTTQNFNTNDGYVRNVGIIAPSQPSDLRWQGNDPYNLVADLGETDLVARVNNYTPLPTANSSLVQGGVSASGGVLPGTNNVQIWKGFTPYSGYAQIGFQAEWSIIASDPLQAPYTNSDTFSFDLRNVANSASLLKLQFTPGINILSNAYTLQTFAAGSATDTVIDLGYGALFTTDVVITGSTYSLSLARIDPVSRAVITNYTDLATGNLATGTTSDDFGTIGVDWVLTSGNNLDPGSNYIVVNQLQVVPEPSTYALLGMAALGLAFFVVRRRRA
jgi:hypothetical protein